MIEIKVLAKQKRTIESKIKRNMEVAEEKNQEEVLVEAVIKGIP